MASVAAQIQEESVPQISTDSLFYDEPNEDEPVSTNIPADTLRVKPRDFDAAKLEELRNDKDFDYAEPPTVGESLWDRFWQWIGEIVNQILKSAISTNWGRVLLYLGCLAVLVVVVMALLKVDAFKVLFKGAEVAPGAGVFHENIYLMDFELLIKEAADKKDFRLAVRLVFLYSLKLLSDGRHIHWQAGKTNHDYLEELATSQLKTGLSELSFYFDYSWYGGFPISQSQFDRVQQIFQTWRVSIG